MAAKMSVLELILSSSPYLRSALGGWPLHNHIEALCDTDTDTDINTGIGIGISIGIGIGIGIGI